MLPLKILQVIYKTGSNSISLLASSFEESPNLTTQIFDCKGGDEKWVWRLVAISHEFDIVHFHNAIAFLAIPIIRLKSPSTKIIITVHDIGFTYKLKTVGFIKSTLLEAMSIIGHLFAHHIVFVSKSARSKNWLKYVNSSNTIITNGLGEVIEGNRKKSNKHLQLFFIGNHFYVKGLDRLISYQSPLQSSFHLFGNVSIGGSEKDQCQYKQWQKTGRVTAYGHVENSKITEFMNSENTVLLLFSTSEASPLGVIECMQHGVPLIATNLPMLEEYGIHDLVQIVTEDVESLQEAVEKIRKNYDTISKAMKLRYEEKFTSHEYCKNHLKLFQKTIS